MQLRFTWQSIPSQPKSLMLWARLPMMEGVDRLLVEEIWYARAMPSKSPGSYSTSHAVTYPFITALTL